MFIAGFMTLIFNETDSFLGLIDNGKTAVIEMAAAAVIGFRREFHNIEDTTTYGVGQLIEQALDLGAEKLSSVWAEV